MISARCTHDGGHFFSRRFWLSAVEQSVVVSPPPTPALQRTLGQMSLAVLGVGETHGSAFARSNVISSVEEVGAYFSAHRVLLFLQLVPSPSQPHDNTRNVLTAWAVRNPAVRVISLLQVPNPLPRPGSPAHSRRLAGLAALHAEASSAVQNLPPSIELVLMLDLERPHAFSAAALVEAVGWGRRWDAVCAASMGSDGVIADLTQVVWGSGSGRGRGAAALTAPAGAAASTESAADPAARPSGPSAPSSPSNEAQDAAQQQRRIMVRSGAVRVHTCSSGLVMYHRRALAPCWHAAPHEVGDELLRAALRGPHFHELASLVNESRAEAAALRAREVGEVGEVVGEVAPLDERRALHGGAGMAPPFEGGGRASAETEADVVGAPSRKGPGKVQEADVVGAPSLSSSLSGSLPGSLRASASWANASGAGAAAEAAEAEAEAEGPSSAARVGPPVPSVPRSVDKEEAAAEEAEAEATAAMESGGSPGTCARASLHQCMGRHGVGALYILPSLVVRQAAPREDLAYLLITLIMLLPALAPCLAFCSRFCIYTCQLRALPAWLRRHASRGVAAARPLLGFMCQALGFMCQALASRLPSSWRNLSLPLVLPLVRSAESPARRALSAARYVLVKRRAMATLALVVLLQVGLLCRQLHRSAAAADVGVGKRALTEFGREIRVGSQYALSAASGLERGVGGGLNKVGELMEADILHCRAGRCSAHLGERNRLGGAEDSELPVGVEAAVSNGYDGHVGLLIPLVLPVLTAVDLLFFSRRSGPLAVRLPAAALTLLTPLFVLLELRRLQSIPVPPPPRAAAELAAGGEGDGVLHAAVEQLAAWLRQPWPNSFGLCSPAAAACGAMGAAPEE